MQRSKISFFLLIFSLLSMSDRMEAMDYDGPEKPNTALVKKREKAKSLEKVSSSKRQKLDRPAKTKAQESISSLFEKKIEAEEIETKESVINIDQRVPIHNPESYIYPWSAQGRVEMLFKAFDERRGDAVGSGSGTVIGKKFVITAGHNLFVRNDTLDDKHLRKYYEPYPYKITFYPGMSSHPGEPEVKARWAITVKKSFLTAEWENLKLSADSAAKYDFGLLVLNEDVGNDTGIYSGYVPNNTFFDKFDVNVTGYPGDLPKLSDGKIDESRSTKVMYTASGKSHRQTDDFLYHKISTFKGNSGGSIWFSDPNPNSNKSFYVGVHTNGLGNENRGVRLTKERADRIKAWMTN